LKYILSCLILFCNYLLIAQTYQASTEIIRDKWGVPHIYAPTDKGVAFGLAWAHAEDDFETIQLPLLSVKGMLGQHLGMEGATVDYVAGLLRLSDIVDKHYESLSKEYLDMLQGYVDGINSYAETYPKEVLVRHSFPITTKDVLKAYVLSLSILSKADEVIKKLVSNDTVFTKNPGSDPTSKGSNAIAISNRITESGETFLAVNSHQPYEGPQAWYEAHLVSEEGWNSLGGLFPGGATIFHGVNPYLGWAHTVNYPDLVDVFKLEEDENKKGLYVIDGQSFELESRKIALKVKTFLGFNLKIKKKAYWSVYGPVIKNKNGYYAFDLGALHDIRAPQQWYEMNKATSWEEFYDAISKVSIPCFNIVYADREGNIFHVGNGKIPVRNESFNWRGILPFLDRPKIQVAPMREPQLRVCPETS